MGDFPLEFKYSESHEYVKADGNILTIGITDYAAEQLGDIVYVELPKVGTILAIGSSFGVVESVKAVSDLYMPVSGKIIETNESLSDNPEILTEDAFEKGWMIKVEVDDLSEFDSLMSASAYGNFVSSL
jgi:glycine cleavage system H protein